MKNKLFTVAAVSGLLALSLIGCGYKYTPLTPEQITAQADSVYNATLEMKKAELAAACDASMAEKVAAKVAELEAANTPQ